MFSFLYSDLLLRSSENNVRIVFSIFNHQLFQILMAFLVLCLLCNTIFVVCAVLSVRTFDEILVEKAGTKVLFQTILKWNQIHHTIAKVDACIIYCILAFDLCYQKVLFLQITAWSGFFTSIVYVVALKYCLRHERKCLLFHVILIRFAFLMFSLYRIIELNKDLSSDITRKNDNINLFTLYILMAICFSITVIVSLKCVNYFGKGFRDMVNYQANAERTQTEVTTTEQSI